MQGQVRGVKLNGYVDWRPAGTQPQSVCRREHSIFFAVCVLLSSFHRRSGKRHDECLLYSVYSVMRDVTPMKTTTTTTTTWRRMMGAAADQYRLFRGSNFLIEFGSNSGRVEFGVRFWLCVLNDHLLYRCPSTQQYGACLRRNNFCMGSPDHPMGVGAQPHHLFSLLHRTTQQAARCTETLLSYTVFARNLQYSSQRDGPLYIS